MGYCESYEIFFTINTAKLLNTLLLNYFKLVFQIYVTAIFLSKLRYLVKLFISLNIPKQWINFSLTQGIWLKLCNLFHKLLVAKDLDCDYGKPFEVNKIEIRGKNLATERSFLLFAHHLMMDFRAVGT